MGIIGDMNATGATTSGTAGMKTPTTVGVAIPHTGTKSGSGRNI